jgi:hypothetical protein
MKRAPHFQPPRQAVIYAHTRRAFDSRALARKQFAESVCRIYCASLAPDLRRVHFKAGLTDADVERALKHNDQIMTRYMDGTVKVLPADLEDAWVQALPEPFRRDCERELAARRGHLPVRIPSAEEDTTADFSTLVCDFGELLSASAPVMRDGQINATDRKHLTALLAELGDVEAGIAAVRQKCERALGLPMREPEPS